MRKVSLLQAVILLTEWMHVILSSVVLSLIILKIGFIVCLYSDLNVHISVFNWRDFYYCNHDSRQVFCSDSLTL